MFILELNHTRRLRQIAGNPTHWMVQRLGFLSAESKRKRETERSGDMIDETREYYYEVGSYYHFNSLCSSQGRSGSRQIRTSESFHSDRRFLILFLL